MTTLMTYAGPAPEDAPGTRTGGLPLVPAGFEWPVCRTCQGHMQFLAQIAQPDAYLSIFMCQNKPGSCEEWDPRAGGNQATLFPPDALTALPAPGGPTRLPEVSAVTSVERPEPEYREARKAWAAEHGDATLEVLGQLGGQPEWLQGDDTPACATCGQPMQLVAQLEEGHNYDTRMNFGGGGSGYAFACHADRQAAFLWQQ